MRPANSQEKQARQTFAEAFDPRNNAFNFLRLILAALVIAGHCFPLGGFGDEKPVPALTGGRHSLGSLAVGMFFLLSGFLIARSGSSHLSAGRFLWHRFLRIFPGYWACLLVCAFVFAPLFCVIEWGDPFAVFGVPNHSAQGYVVDNALMFQPHGFSAQSILAVCSNRVAGLLAHNPYPFTLNGSLWTLPIEVVCYVAVAGMVALGAMRKARVVAVVVFAFLCGLYEANRLNPEAVSHYFSPLALTILIPFCLYFSAGCVCFLYREIIPYSKPLFLGSLCLACLSLALGSLDFLVPFVLPYAFLCLGFKLPVGRFQTKGDYSYGTYIYAFPIQQGLALVGVPKAGFALYFASCLFLTGILAVLSYRYVEAPCLRWKNFELGASLRTWLGKTTPEPALALVPVENCPRTPLLSELE